MQEQYWNEFIKTGRVTDYLSYKQKDARDTGDPIGGGAFSSIQYRGRNVGEDSLCR